MSSDRVVALGTVFLSFTCHYRVGSTRKHIPTEMPEDWGQLTSLLSIHILIVFRSTSCLLWLEGHHAISPVYLSLVSKQLRNIISYSTFTDVEIGDLSQGSVLPSAHGKCA